MKLLLLLVVGASCQSSSSPSSELTGEALRDHINSVQSLWTAKVPKHSRLDSVMKTKPARPPRAHKHARNKRGSETENTSYDIANTFDARLQFPECAEGIGYIRDQSKCGCCWAFATTEVLSNRICIVSNGTVKPVLSAQDLMTCSNGMNFGAGGLYGCSGGNLYDAFNYAIQVGISTGGGYYENIGCKPYFEQPCGTFIVDNITHTWNSGYCTGTNPTTPTCASSCTNKAYNVSYANDKYYAQSVECYDAFDDSGDWSLTDMMNEIMTNGPLGVQLTIYTDFDQYSSGIYKHTYGSLVGYHAVRIIGWGTANGTDYWLATNSWGTDFGEDGFFRIARGVNEVGIESDVCTGLPAAQYYPTPAPTTVPPTTAASTTPSTAATSPPTTSTVPPTQPPTTSTVPPTRPPTTSTVPPTQPPTTSTVPPTNPPTTSTVPPTHPPTTSTVPPTQPPTTSTVPPTRPRTTSTVPPTQPPTTSTVPPTNPPTTSTVPPTTSTVPPTHPGTTSTAVPPPGVTTPVYQSSNPNCSITSGYYYDINLDLMVINFYDLEGDLCLTELCNGQIFSIVDPDTNNLYGTNCTTYFAQHIVTPLDAPYALNYVKSPVPITTVQPASLPAGVTTPVYISSNPNCSTFHYEIDLDRMVINFYDAEGDMCLTELCDGRSFTITDPETDNIYSTNCTTYVALRISTPLNASYALHYVKPIAFNITVGPTTAAPTTVAPTTAAPTTAAPTTVAPTTVAPTTTAAPTTTCAAALACPAIGFDANSVAQGPITCASGTWKYVCTSSSKSLNVKQVSNNNKWAPVSTVKCMADGWYINNVLITDLSDIVQVKCLASS